MKHFILRLFALVLVPPLGAHCETLPIASVSDLRAACTNLSSVGRTFDVIGNVLAYNHRPVKHEWSFTVGDGRAHIVIYERNVPGCPATNLNEIALNDLVRIQGVVYEYQGRAHAGYKDIRLVRSCPFRPDPVSPQMLFLPENLGRLFRLRGTVREAFRDEGDPNYVCMTLNCSGETLYVMMAHLAEFSFDPSRYIGAKVIVSGLCSDTTDCLRRQIRRLLIVSGPENIQVISPPESDISKIPNIADIRPLPPTDISRLGRHQASGTVLTVWHGDKVLVRTPEGRIVKACLLAPPLPNCGREVRIVGLPETDLYFLNLSHATWECLPDAKTTPPDAVRTVSPHELLTNAIGDPQIHVKAHGQLLRMTGIVRHLPQMRDQNAAMQVESDGYLVPVDVSSCVAALDGLSIGSVVSVTGTCVIDITNNGQDASTPKARGFFIVLNSPGDLVVISRPPWWTTGRLLTLLGILAAALLGVIGWNVSLNRRARAKGRELAAEQLAHVTSELKVNERTRLAVELHDALSQTLTGVSMQIDTAAGFAAGKVPAISKCLSLASRTIDACRTELRNTLWDLRSAALDEPSMDAAIRKTLCQCLAGIDLSVRFNVAREVFSDNTAHAVLKIIRELATNAIRHGKATALKIAGTIDGGKLLFSVRDNGCGFDPDLAPGISQGHFGLQGISERLERLNGVMKIESTIGKGAKVTVVLPIPHTGE